jgi:hypothetical protein
MLAVRVEVTGLRPSPLPHHRASGFPHTAVGSVKVYKTRRDRIESNPTFLIQRIHVVQLLLACDPLELTRRSTSTSFLRTLTRILISFASSAFYSFACFVSFGPSLQPNYWPSSLLRPLQTSLVTLTTEISPGKVR